MNNQDINQARLDQFAAAYEKNLAHCVATYPTEYAFPADRVPTVAARMKAAFAAGSYNKDGRAVKMTCQELGIPYTYAGINGFLRAKC